MSQPLNDLALMALDDAAFAVVITDMTQPDHPIIYGNAAFETLTGYTKDEFIGKNPRFLQGDDRDQPGRSKLRKAIEGGKPVRTTLQNYRKDGSMFIDEIYIAPIHNADGELTHFMGIQNDVTKITAKKRAWEKTVQEALSLGGVLDASINEIFMFDAETLKFLQVNQGARENLGYTMDELKEMTPLSFKPRFTQDQFEALIAPLKTSEAEKINFTTVHQRKNGTLYPVDVHLQRSKLGERPIFLAVILDITSRTETQAALEQAQRFLQSAPDATIIVNEEGIIQYASEQTSKLLGYSQQELLGANVDTLVPAGMRDRHEKQRASFKARPKSRMMGDGDPLFAHSKDGRDIPVEVSLSPIQTAEGLLISASLRDITDRIEAEQGIREARDQAEAATLAKSRFLAAASHDLRQPLQSLSLYLSAMTNLTDDPKALAIAEKMETSLTAMGGLLNTLLDISQLESGSITPEKRTFSAQSLLNTVVADYAPIAAEKGLSLDCETSSHNIYTDLALLTRILENFVSNAIRYTDEGGVSVTCEKVGANLVFSVSDSGVGISLDAQDKVFDEYYQLGNAHREQGKGLGLGLAVVKHISTLLGHEVSVESVEGKGSKFSVSVPISDEIEVLDASLIDRKQKRSPNAAPVILCIDDNPAVLDSVTMLLDVVGFDVFQAEHGEAAMAHIDSGLRPDILLSDYRLPGDNGIEVVKRIRETLSDNLPAIMMSGDTSAKEIQNSGLERLEVMTKPVDVKRLVALIKEMTV
jgi:PAS domain S-box-containing protein